MGSWLDELARHGGVVLFAVCFLEAAGVPIPAAIALLTAGALMATGNLSVATGVGSAAAAFLIADVAMYLLGRRTGWWLLNMLCRISTDPESCILSSARSFYKRGRMVLMVAKFLPGLGAMAAPLAGSMRMRLRDFLVIDVAGIVLYAGTYMGLGYLFSNLLSAMADLLGQAGRVAEAVLIAGLAAFLAYRLWIVWKNRAYQAIPKVNAEEVDGPVFDVRSHGYYEPGTQRIRGSIRLEPNRIFDTFLELPQAEKIYLYCT